MAVMDEFKEERDKIKDAPLKAKLIYFKDYYLLPTIIAVSVTIAVIAVICSIIFNKEDVMYALLVNYIPLPTEETEIIEPFTERYIDDPKREELIVDSGTYITAESPNPDPVKYSAEAEQKITMLVMTGSADFFISGEDIFDKYVPNGCFVPLSNALSSEEIAALGDRVIMYEGQPAGIYMDDCALLQANFEYAGKTGVRPVAAFMAGSKHADKARDFFYFLEGR